MDIQENKIYCSVLRKEIQPPTVVEFSYVATHIKANTAHDSCLILQSNDLTVFWKKIKIQVTDPCCLPVPLTEVAGTSEPPLCQFLSSWFTMALNTFPRRGKVKLGPTRETGYGESSTGWI